MLIRYKLMEENMDKDKPIQTKQVKGTYSKDMHNGSCGISRKAKTKEDMEKVIEKLEADFEAIGWVVNKDDLRERATEIMKGEDTAEKIVEHQLKDMARSQKV